MSLEANKNMVENIQSVIIIVLASNALLAFLIGPELILFPSFHKTLTFVTNFNIDRMSTIALGLLLLLILPIISITFILCAFKKYTFGSYKSVKNSYSLALKLLIVSYFMNLMFVLIDFLTKLAFNKNAYILLRVLSSYEDHPYRYHTTLCIINSMIFQAFAFIFCFAVAEMTIAYIKSTRNQDFTAFIKSNTLSVVFIITISVFYLSTLFYLEKCFSIKNVAKLRASQPVCNRLDIGLMVAIFLGCVYGNLSIDV